MRGSGAMRTIRGLYFGIVAVDAPGLDLEVLVPGSRNATRLAYNLHGLFSPLPLLYLRQRRFRLGQPEGHLHGTVEVDGSRKCRADLLPLAGRGIQHAQAAVAVGLEWAHA